MARPPQMVVETTQQRTDRIRNEERKRHSARGMEQLRARYGIIDEADEDDEHDSATSNKRSN
jgi:hypothetical protein